MRKIVLILAAALPIFAQGSHETVPVGPLAIPFIVVGAAGYGVYRLVRKKK